MNGCKGTYSSRHVEVRLRVIYQDWPALEDLGAIQTILPVQVSAAYHVAGVGNTQAVQVLYTLWPRGWDKQASIITMTCHMVVCDGCELFQVTFSCKYTAHFKN